MFPFFGPVKHQKFLMFLIGIESEQWYEKGLKNLKITQSVIVRPVSPEIELFRKLSHSAMDCCLLQNNVKNFLIIFYYVMFCATWYHLHNFKNVKNADGRELKPKTWLEVTLLLGCFSRFLNCKNGTMDYSFSKITECHWTYNCITTSSPITTSGDEFRPTFNCQTFSIIFTKNSIVDLWLVSK